MRKVLIILFLLPIIVFGQGSVDKYTTATTPTSYHSMYDGSGYDYVGQSFACSETVKLTHACMYFARQSATGTLYMYVYSHSGTYGSTGVPNTLLATSDGIDVGTYWTNSYVRNYFFQFTGSNQITLSSGTNYFLVFAHDAGSASVYINAYYGSSASGNRAYSSDGSSWTYSASNDYYFQVYGMNTTATVIDNLVLFATHSTNLSLYSGSSNAYISQSFTCSENTNLAAAQFTLAKSGSPTGYAYAALYAHSGTYGSSSKPTGSALAVSEGVDVSGFLSSTSYPEYITFTFTGSNRYQISTSTYYCIVVYYVSGNSSNYVRLFYKSSSLTDGNEASSSNGSTWSNPLGSYDVFYYVFGEPVSGYSHKVNWISPANIEKVNYVETGNIQSVNSIDK